MHRSVPERKRDHAPNIDGRAKSTKKPSFILRTENLTSVVIQLRSAAESEVFFCRRNQTNSLDDDRCIPFGVKPVSFCIF